MARRGKARSRFTITRPASEWVIVLVGLVAALIEAVFVENQNLAVIIVVITLLITVATLEVKAIVREESGNDTRRLLDAIPEKWRADASLRVDKVIADLREWEEGRRPMSRDRSIPYQISLVREAKESVDAIHLATPTEKLDRWLNPTGHFGNFVEAHKGLRAQVKKRRILFLDDRAADLFETSESQKRFVDPRVAQFVKEQTSEFGVELRALLRSDLEDQDIESPPDLLIVDRREAVIVSNIVDAVGKEHFDTTVFVNPTRVLDYVNTFEDNWNVAQSPTQYLDDADA